MVKYNNYSAGLKLYFDNKVLIDGIFQYNNGLSDYNAKVAEELNKQADKDAVTSTAILVITIISSYASVSVGTIIGKSISIPVNEVAANLNEIANGNLK